MLATIRAAKGQGNAALYVRARDAAGRFWNWGALAWETLESEVSRVYLLELQDADLVESRYQEAVQLPAGDVVVEYVRAADSRVVGEESGRTTLGESTIISLTGSGAYAVTVAVRDSQAPPAPVPGVQVQAWQGGALVALGATDAAGLVVFALAAGAVELVCSKMAFGTFPRTTATVSGATTVTVAGVAAGVPAPPAAPELCTVYEYLLNQDGTPAVGVVAKLRIVLLPASFAGSLFAGDEVEATADAAGLVEWAVPRGCTVGVQTVRRAGARLPFGVEKVKRALVPNAATARLSECFV